MYRRTFMKLAGVLGAGKVSNGIQIKEPMNEIDFYNKNIIPNSFSQHKKEHMNIVEYAKRGGRFHLGMYIADSPRFGTPVLGWVYKIISVGSYKITLIMMGWGCSFKGKGIYVNNPEGCSDIHPETIYKLIKKCMKFRSPSSICKMEDFVVLDEEGVDLVLRQEKNHAKRSFKIEE